MNQAAGASQYDLVVIGSGPGGYVGAIRASQLGLKVALVEKSVHLGGTCLNVGCIPTKSLLESAKTYDKLQHSKELGFDIGKVAYDWQRIMDRKDGIVEGQRKGLQFLMKKNKIDVHKGFGRLTGPTSVSVTSEDNKVTTLNTKKIMIATGSRVRELPFAKSNSRGILTSDSVLFIDHVPKSMAIIGGGVVGIEFASLFGRFGTQVTVIEMGPQILPFEDEETVAELTKHLKKQNITLELSTKLTAIEDKGDKVLVTTEGKPAREFAKALVSIGREAVTNDIGLDKVGLKTERGFIPVDKQYKTAIPSIYAIGDVIATPALAHTASAEAIIAAEVIANHHTHEIDYLTNPNAVYCYPEIASVGYTEKALKEKKIDYKVAKFPFMPNAKAKIEGASDGFVKLLYGTKYKEILGAHIVNARATEIIAEFVVGKVLETTVEELAQSIHPHPTMSEVVMEVAHVAVGGAIHL